MKVTPETHRQHYIRPSIYLAFQYFGIECTWWRFLHKRVVCTTFDIYVFARGLNFYYYIYWWAIIHRVYHMSSSHRGYHMSSSHRGYHMSSSHRGYHMSSSHRGYHMSSSHRGYHMYSSHRGYHMYSSHRGHKGKNIKKTNIIKKLISNVYEML